MNASPPSSVALPVALLLQELLQRFQAGFGPGLQAGLRGIDAAPLALPHTLVGALCLGGADFAAHLALHAQGTEGLDEGYARVLDAFNGLLEAPLDAPLDHEARVARALVADFGLSVDADHLLDIVRCEFLIAIGPLDEVPQAALAAIRVGQWALALRGLERCQAALQTQTPADVHGLTAFCLHKLGRYDEAERQVARGLGERAALLSIGPVRTETELLGRWAGRHSPVVSIVCTTYNHARYIDSAIRGFLSQDCPFPFEVLIHDDASTDGTADIVRRWHARYPQLIRPVLQTQNQFSRGVRPFELLLAKARGDFVATCEGDDFWLDPHKLRRQVEFLQANPAFSCSAHNYHHFVETSLTVKPWTRQIDYVLTAQQLMGLYRLLWLPTLVFRKTFSKLPPQRALAPIGDQFLTSYLGTKGPCMYFGSMLAAVRRENEFSTWSPLSDLEKERIRIKTWQALICMHEEMGNAQAVADLNAKVSASPLNPGNFTAQPDRPSQPGPHP